MTLNTRFFEAAVGGDVYTLTEALDQEPSLGRTDDRDGDTGLIVAAGAGHASVVERLIAAGADVGHLGRDLGDALCWAALGGHAHVVDVLIPIAGARSVGRAGAWARRSVEPGRAVVLEALRAAPQLNAIWKAAGLPYERRDNFTMTELRLEERKTPTPDRVLATSAGMLRAEELPGVQEERRARLAIHRLQQARCSSEFGIFRLVNASVSSIYETGVGIEYVYGFETGGDIAIDDVPGVAFGKLPSSRYASSHFRGPYGQMGYAHALLREMIARAGLTDAAREIREEYVYWEAPESDANIVAIKIAIED
jgi:hypothetical protein